jgi:actin-related protein
MVGKTWKRVGMLLYKEFKVDPSKHSVLITNDSFDPKRNLQKISEIMFDIFIVPSFYIFNSNILFIYALETTTAVVLGSGHSVTHIIAVHEDLHFQNE